MTRLDFGSFSVTGVPRVFTLPRLFVTGRVAESAGVDDALVDEPVAVVVLPVADFFRVWSALTTSVKDMLID